MDYVGYFEASSLASPDIFTPCASSCLVESLVLKIDGTAALLIEKASNPYPLNRENGRHGL
jgi:hypothetical protein